MLDRLQVIMGTSLFSKSLDGTHTETAKGLSKTHLHNDLLSNYTTQRLNFFTMLLHMYWIDSDQQCTCTRKLNRNIKICT